MTNDKTKRFLIHLGIGAALSVVLGLGANLGALHVSPQVAGILGVVLGSLASYLRKAEAETADPQ